MAVAKRLAQRIVDDSRRLTVLTCILFVLIPPAIAFGGTVFTYAQGISGIGSVWCTTGPGGNCGGSPRDFDRVYHQIGYSWNPFYCWNGNCFGGTNGTQNPIYANGSASYAIAYCHNLSDNSGVTWTCQSTK
jgi:hypothetical protein